MNEEITNMALLDLLEQGKFKNGCTYAGVKDKCYMFIINLEDAKHLTTEEGDMFIFNDNKCIKITHGNL